MTDDTEFISVRLPADVANWLRQYASDNNLIRAGKPNMGGSVISAIRERMNGIETMSNNVGHSDIDIQAVISKAIATAKIEIESDYMLAIIDAKHEMRKFVIDAMIPDPAIEEATATAKKAPVLAPHLKALALEKILQVA